MYVFFSSTARLLSSAREVKYNQTFFDLFIIVFVRTVFYFYWQFEPYTQKGNEGFVHHFLVYECYGVFNDTHYGAGWDCIENANMPSAVRQCYANSIVAVWGFGGEVGS